MAGSRFTFTGAIAVVRLFGSTPVRVIASICGIVLDGYITLPLIECVGTTPREKILPIAKVRNNARITFTWLSKPPRGK